MRHAKKAGLSNGRMKSIIREHYRLNRPVTDAELTSEIENLSRRRDYGMLDDRCERLFHALEL